jgi:hypothetical protein
MLLIFNFVGYHANLSAFPFLKPSSIENIYDIPIAIPVQTSPSEGSTIKERSLGEGGFNSENISQDILTSHDTLTSLASCNKLPIMSVIANGNDGNLPSNAIDKDLNTRWSNNGLGSYIQLDLGSKKSLCSVDIAWYRGDIRQNNFVISVSNDGTTFTNKFSGTSNLGTVAEKYSLPAGTEGRYVRITVNGNTENQWASVTELAVYGLEQASSGPIILKKQTAPGSNTWTPYKSLGGNFQSDPSVIRNTDNTLQVFAVSAANGELLYKKQTAPGSNTWTPYKSLGGNIQSDPSVTLNNAGRLEAFVVGGTSQAPGNNQSPTADSKTYSTGIGTPVEITLSGQDPNGDPITFDIVSPPLHGQLSTISPANKVVYTPTSGFIGSDTFTYVAKDNQGATSPTAATVSITVSSGGGGTMDQFGIRKIYPDGQFNMNAQFIKGRQDSSSNRWNVASDEPPGAIPSPKTNIHYEVTGYIKVSQQFDGFNLKFWGPHHGSSGIPFEGSSTPCCWYDTGIDSNGDVITQIEFPHPVNIDKPLPPGSISNIGDIVGKWIGVKWIVFKDSTGLRHVEMWYDKAGLDAADKPGNQWQRLFEKLDSGDWMKSTYSPPDQQEIELRIRNVSPESIQVRYLYVRDITPPGSS